MINIFAPTTELSMTNNGDATLVPSSCILSMKINGAWVVKLEHPFDKEGRWKFIEEDAVLRIDIEGGFVKDYTKQFFRIDSVDTSLKSVMCEAHPIALDAKDEVIITNISCSGATGANFANQLSNLSIMQTLGYSVVSDIVDKTGTIKAKNTNLIAVINGDEPSFVSTWGAEVRYDNKNIYLNGRVDEDNDPIQILLGRDISDLNYKVDVSEIMTRIYPLNASGYQLNQNEDYAIGSYPYVDSPYIGNYPIIHSCVVPTHFMLVTLDSNNEDSECYNMTIGYLDSIQQMVSTFTHNWYDTLEAQTGYKRNIEYLQYILNLTKSVEGVSGIWETIYNAYARVLHNSSVKEIVGEAVRNGCQWIEELTIPEYILVDVTDGGVTKTIYCNSTDETDRAKTDWVYLEGKWMYFDSDGYYDSSKDDTSEWSWYQPSGKSYKRYGNKTNGHYLKSQWYEINGTWYWFNGNGKGIKNKALRLAHLDPLEADAVEEIDYITQFEEEAYQRMYVRMTAFAEDMYANGADKPKMSLDVSTVDPSSIHKDLRTALLGDNVHVKGGAVEATERVVEIEYDCIRKLNNKIVLGNPSGSIELIINKSMISSVVANTFIAGDGITIEGNVIGALGGFGSGGSGGLKYWTETPNAIYQEMETGAEGGWSAPKQYLRTAEIKWTAGRPFGSTPIHLETRPNPRRPDTLAAWWKKDGYWMMLFMSDEEQNVNVYDSATSEEYAGKYYGNLYGIDWYVKEVYAFQTDYPAEFIDEGNIFFIEDDPEYMANWRGHPYEYLAQLVFKTTYVRAGMGFDDYSYLFWGGTGKYDPGQIPYYVTQDGLIHTDEDVEIGEVSVAGSLTYLNEYKQDVLTAGDGISIDDETDEISVNPFTGATSEADGSKGGVPQPLIADRNKYLKGDGTWGDPTPPDMTGATSQDNGVHGLVPAPLSTDRNKYLKGDGTWAEVQGGGGAGAEEMTKAQYDALTTEQKNDGTIRFIYDYP